VSLPLHFSPSVLSPRLPLHVSPPFQGVLLITIFLFNLHDRLVNHLTFGTPKGGLEPHLCVTVHVPIVLPQVHQLDNLSFWITFGNE
jgi:hypothetical protein